LSDDETIRPGDLEKDRKILSGDTTAPYLDNGRSRLVTSVDSELSGPVKKYLPCDIVDGAYQLTALLGRGGMGVVFACKHLIMNQDYAIKILSGETLSSEHWERFRAEAKVLAKLNHPNIVSIYNMGVDNSSCPYYVMDLLRGEPLDIVISRRQSLPIDQALDCFIQVADALSNAHNQGVIHRDIKPSNLMLIGQKKDNIGQVKLVDFGIARMSKQNLGTQSQTATGMVFGTPYYMSPEQTQGKKVDERSDIYSFGCSLFEALTGTLPFRGENAFHTFMIHQTETAPRLSERAPDKHFPPALELAVDKMLRKDPASRYQKMSMIKHDLERIAGGKEISLRGGQSTSVQQEMEAQVADQGPSPGQSDHSKKYMIAGVIIFFVALFAAGYWTYRQSLSKPLISDIPAAPHYQAGTDREEMEPWDVMDRDKIAVFLKNYGCSKQEVKMMYDYDFEAENQKQREVSRRFEKFFANLKKNNQTIFNRKTGLINFPSDAVIGALSINGAQLVLATGVIKVPDNSDLCFFQNLCLSKNSDFVEMFGPDDLTGLELQLKKPDQAIGIIKHWNSLKHLSFFNPLLKPLPMFENYDESNLTDQSLDEIDKIKGLEMLGLAGGETSGAKVAAMAQLHQVSSLRLKRVRDIDLVLDKIATLDNLKEIWLVRQDLTDAQLQKLVPMKNLQSLCIRRSKLTPASWKIFQQMQNLKELTLDCNWSEDERNRFRQTIPFVKFESILDATYWTVMVGNDSTFKRGRHHHHHEHNLPKFDADWLK